MPKRSSKGKGKVTKLSTRERDVNQLATSVMRRTLELSEGEGEGERQKDPAAVALGRRGGLIGGKARMASLTEKQRHALAVKAARARWKRA